MKVLKRTVFWYANFAKDTASSRVKDLALKVIEDELEGGYKRRRYCWRRPHKYKQASVGVEIWSLQVKGDSQGQPSREISLTFEYGRPQPSSLKKVEWRENGQLHRDDDHPSVIRYRTPRFLRFSLWDDNLFPLSGYAWFKRNRLSRKLGQPHCVSYNLDGRVYSAYWTLDPDAGSLSDCYKVYYDNHGKIETIICVNRPLTYPDGPNEIAFHNNGSIRMESWRAGAPILDSVPIHRENGPATIEYESAIMKNPRQRAS